MHDTNTDVNDKCNEQNKDATMQLLIQEFASKSDPSTARGGPSLQQVIGSLRHDFSIKGGYIAHLGKILHITYGYSVGGHCKGVFQ